MPELTPNLALKKPLGNEQVTRTAYNENLDLIDQNVYSLVGAHLADYIRQPGYAVTAGSANTYTVSTDPAPSAYVDGMGIVARIHIANTGTSTVNWDELGAKAIVDSKGNALTSGKLPAGGRVHLRYSSAAGNFQLVGEGGEYGTAGAAQVLTGYSIGTDSGLVNGTMPNNGSLGTITPGTTNQSIPAGYTSGGTVLGDADLVAGNIKSGVNIFGVTGTFDKTILTVGDTILAAADTYQSLNPGQSTYTKVKEIQMNVDADSIRVSFDLLGSGTAAIYGRIYKNGVAIGTQRSRTDGTWASWSEDFTNINSGDLIQLYARFVGADGTGSYRNFRIKTSPHTTVNLN